MPKLKNSGLLKPFFLLFALPALFACTPAFIGAESDGLYSSLQPPVEIKANPPLKLLNYGRLLDMLQADELLGPNVVMNYAVFSDTEQGPVTKHAHAIITSLDAGWEFEPVEHNMNVISSGASGQGPYRWTTQLLFVPAAEDWMSDLWKANGRDTPKVWLAKRWTATPLPDTRFVAEYREEMPQCLMKAPYDGQNARGMTAYDMVKNLMLPMELANCGSALRDFEARADQSFTFARPDGTRPEAPALAKKLVKPQTIVRGNKLLGDVRLRDLFPLRF